MNHHPLRGYINSSPVHSLHCFFLVSPFFLLKISLKSRRASLFLIDRHVFWIFCMKEISIFLSSLSSPPPLIPVRKQLIVFPPSLFNLPAMRWKTRKVYFLAYCLRLWRQSVNSIPTNLCVCVCVHICSCARSYSLRLSPFNCARPPMVLSISFHASVGFSACEAAFLPTTSVGYQ